ncbi:MAG: hypothetical protein ACKPKO_28635 [Candidatus Fonsibacter sp.]
MFSQKKILVCSKLFVNNIKKNIRYLKLRSIYLKKMVPILNYCNLVYVEKY